MVRLSTFLTVVLSAVSAVAIRLPAPSGPHTVGTHIYTFTDTSRAESHNTTQRRKILAQYFYPTSRTYSSSASTYRYAPPAALRALETNYGLPSGLLSPISTNSHYEPHLAHSRKLQAALIFSPGFGNSRVIYTSLLEDLASHGYLVVSLDHPYDSLLTEFPDGTSIATAVPSPETDAVIHHYLDIRTADILYVASRLPRSQRIGVFGHSLGGAAAARAIAANPQRFSGGLNMDGRLFQTPAVNLQTPFLLLGRQLANRTGDDKIASWSAFREVQACFANEISLKKFQHGTFTDFPAIVELLSIPKSADIEALLGTVDGMRSQVILRKLLAAFWGFTLGGKNPGAVAAERKDLPEVVFEGDVDTKRCGGKSGY
ncbi:Alpha/Beta hydrolase protein [Geopyxis carbonaria]|nr:Alpha/Beta hydrolase protein [Geopyxis carbonaria]